MGARLERLIEHRDELKRVMDAVESGAVFAQLSARYTDVLTQIETCEAAEPAEEATALDELRAKRAARSPKGSASAKGAKSR